MKSPLYNFRITIPSFLQKTRFENNSFQDVDFSEAVINGAILDNCDLLNAVFDRTNLEKCDLSTAYNYSINPENKNIKKAKFSLNGLPGLLNNYDIVIQ